MKKQLIPILILSSALLYGCADHLPEKETATLPASGASFAEQGDAAPQADPPAVITETEAGPGSVVNTDTADVSIANTDTANTDTANADTADVSDIPQSVVSQPEDGTIADSGCYRVATSISSVEVERYAAQVRQQFLAHDWTAVASEIAYPVTISDITYSSSAAFLEASENFEGNLDEAFFSALEAEDCIEMFCNYQGIMLGETGQVWIGEVLDENLVSQGLKIIAINGLTNLP